MYDEPFGGWRNLPQERSVFSITFNIFALSTQAIRVRVFFYLGKAPSSQSRRSIEARLAAHLAAMFSASDLLYFMRHNVSIELVDSLPSPHSVSRRSYAAAVSEKLFDHALVTPQFFSALCHTRPNRAAEIRTLERACLVALGWCA